MEIKYFLAGEEVNAPKEWQDTKIRMAFNNHAEPILTLEDFTFFNEHIAIINDHLAKSGVFEGLPFAMKLSDDDGRQYQFNGFLDLTQLKIKSPVEYQAKLKTTYGLNSLDDKLRALSFGYLAQEKRWFSESDYTDIKVVVKRKFDTLEVIVASIGIYIITKDVLEHTKSASDEITKLLSQLSAAASTAVGGFIIQLIGSIIYHLAYFALMLIALIKLIKALQENLAPRTVTYKGITLKKGIEKSLEYLGLALDCDIEELNSYVYLPSKTGGKIRANRRDEGIPNASDYGYNLAEFFEVALKLFNADWTVVNNTFIIRNEGSEFWTTQSKNIMPSSIETEAYQLNANEMAANRIISFQYDPSDDWTMPGIKNEGDYTAGTQYQVITDFDSQGGQISKMNKGLDEINIPLALGKRRDKLSAGDIALKTLFFISDQLIKLFGGNTVAEKINEHKGALMISSPNFDIAKLLFIENKLIPANHRERLSAKVIYEKFYISKSFVYRADLTQRKIYNNIKIPFDFVKFVEYLESPFFTTEADTSPHGGKKGKLLEIEWSMGADEAIANFYINEKYINNKLTEYGIIA